MLELARELSGLKGERYMGAEIAELLWCRELAEGSREPLRVLSDRHGVLVVEVRGSAETLKVTMLLRQPGQHGPESAMGNGFVISEEIKEHAIWHVFSKQEITEFVEKAGDRNPLHQGAHPIVPGLLLLERLLGDAAFRGCGRMQLRFRHPAFAEEPLWVVLMAKENFRIFSPREILCEGCVATCR